MNESKTSTQTTAQPVPAIRRVIDGQEFTVLIHFSETAKETAKEKMKRVIVREVRNNGIPA